MKISKSDLKRALEIVKPGLANKEIIDQTTSFAFIDGKVITYNDEICITHPIKDINFQGAVRAEELYKFLGKSEADEIDITINENEIVMKAGRSKVGLPLQVKILLPLDEELTQKGKWKNLPENFVSALTFAEASCSRDLSNAKMICVHINEQGFIEGTDNLRISHWNLKSPIPFPTILVPHTSILEVVKINPIQAAKGNGWVHFKNEEGTIISCRVFNEKFVDTAPFLNSKEKGKVVDFPSSLTAALDRAQIFVEKQEEKDVNLTLNDKFLTVSSESERGWFKENIPTKNKGEAFTFMIAPNFLKAILSKTTKCELFKGRLKFEGEDWVYITSLKG